MTQAEQALSLEPLPTLAGLEREWSRLAELSGNVFSTWEWASAWWHHFGRRRPLAITGCRRSSGELGAILPLYRATTRPARVARLIGHGPGDELGPVCRPADRPAAARALGSLVRDAEFACDVLIADDLPGGVPWSALTGGRPLVRRPSPVVRTEPASWDDFLATKSANLRRQVRKRERRLARSRRLRYRVTRDPDRLAADLDTFFALHEARWSRAGGSRAFAGREAFHREFAGSALRRGWLRLRFLELDGRPVAALYNLRFGGVESCYQAGRDPAFDSDGVGFVLHAHAIREAVRDGLGEYRFLRGGEAYKRRFADCDPGVETVALARGARGRLALAGIVATGGLPRRLRRRIPAPWAWGSGGVPAGGGT